jgi:hypothetical protein
MINRISNRHSRLVEDTTALEKMYVEGNSGKITRNFGKWRASWTYYYVISGAAQNLRGRTV